VKRLISNLVWYLPVNRLIRLIFGYNNCSELPLLVLTLLHMSNKLWELEEKEKVKVKVKTKKLQEVRKMMAKHKLKLRPKLNKQQRMKLE
jgi:hypothetical protein